MAKCVEAIAAFGIGRKYRKSGIPTFKLIDIIQNNIEKSNVSFSSKVKTR